LKTIKLTEEIKKAAEEKYKEVAQGKTMRGTARRGIIAACVFWALREIGDIRTADQIRQLFDLTKKSFQAGLSKYLEAFPDDRTKHTRPEDLVYGVMNRIQLPSAHLTSILKLMKLLSRCSRTMVHSSPQSVTAAVVYLYLCMHSELKESLGITKTRFATKVALSDITVTKLAKEAKEYLEQLPSESKDDWDCKAIVISDVKPRKVRRIKKIDEEVSITSGSTDTMGSEL
jgi:transcription initiation factor TFIIIB Brf1 subunit/transcription initiation factor TFIIB